MKDGETGRLDVDVVYETGSDGVWGEQLEFILPFPTDRFTITGASWERFVAEVERRREKCKAAKEELCQS